MGLTSRKQILSDITKSKSNIINKKNQIRSSRKRASFQGVRIQDQFSTGFSGLKNFRSRRVSEKKQALKNIGTFSEDLVSLNSVLVDNKQRLFDFDNNLLGEL